MIENPILLVTEEREQSIIYNKIKADNVKVINLNEKFNKNQLKNEKAIFLLIDLEKVETVKGIINKVRNIKKICEKKTIKLGIEEGNIIGEIIGEDNKRYKNDIIKCIQALFINNRKEQIEYIYDTVCNQLDEEFIENNYCDFKGDVCKAKRVGECSKRVTMGCCHKYKIPFFMMGNLTICPYLKEKKCETKCMACKLFTCDAIEKKFKLKEIPLIDYFFNPIQKFIVKSTFFTSKEKIIKRLVFFNTHI